MNPGIPGPGPVTVAGEVHGEFPPVLLGTPLQPSQASQLSILSLSQGLFRRGQNPDDSPTIAAARKRRLTVQRDHRTRRRRGEEVSQTPPLSALANHLQAQPAHSNDALQYPREMPVNSSVEPEDIIDHSLPEQMPGAVPEVFLPRLIISGPLIITRLPSTADTLQATPRTCAWLWGSSCWYCSVTAPAFTRVTRLANPEPPLAW